MLLLPDAEIMADDTNGPMNAEVLPTCVQPKVNNKSGTNWGTKLTTENSAKNKNLG